MNPNRKALRWIWDISGKVKRNVFLLTCIRVVSALSGVLYALILQRVVDSAVDGNKEELGIYLLCFAGILLLLLTLHALARVVNERARVGMQMKFRERLLSQLLSRDYSDVCATHTGEWMNRMTSDVNVVVIGATQIVPDVVGAVAKVFSAAAALLVMVPGLLIALLIGGVVIGVASLFFRKKLKSFHSLIQRSDGNTRSFIQECLMGMPVIHSFNREKSVLDSASALMHEHKNIRMKRIRFVNLCNIAIHASVQGAQLLGVALCAAMIVSGSLTYGAMSAILHLIGQLEEPFSGVSKHIPQFFNMIASAERLMEPETYAEDAEKTPKPADEIRDFYRSEFAALRMNDVCFKYRDNAENIVLDHVSFTLKKGCSVAITGESGCGKSTLLKILLGLYKTNQGEILLDTVSGEEIPLDTAYRSLFAYVPQGNLLFSGTVREMLSFSDEALMKDDEKLWNALRVAAADDIIRQRPEGLDTILGEGGRGFSEGQIQRLAIARAILFERPILLFDEATSSLDEDTERKVLQNIKEMTGFTVILVTHKEASRESCDIRLDLAGKPNDRVTE